MDIHINGICPVGCLADALAQRSPTLVPSRLHGRWDGMLCPGSTDQEELGLASKGNSMEFAVGERSHGVSSQQCETLTH